jgi:hypothetical protein
MKTYRLLPVAFAAILASACHDGSVTAPDARTPDGPARDGVNMMGSGHAFGGETGTTSDTPPTVAGDTTGRGVNMMGSGN